MIRAIDWYIWFLISRTFIFDHTENLGPNLCSKFGTNRTGFKKSVDDAIFYFEETNSGKKIVGGHFPARPDYATDETKSRRNL